MGRYDYFAAVKEDVKNFLENNIDLKKFKDRDDLVDYLNDKLWTIDSVTGDNTLLFAFSGYRGGCSCYVG